MKKQLIALRGRSSVGKSSALHLLYKCLIANPVVKPVRFEALGRKLDFLAIVSVEGHAIGIFSRGDVPATVQSLLDRLVVDKCQVIVCAARTKGEVENVLKSPGRKYKLVEVNKEAKRGNSEAVSNHAAAYRLAALVYDALDAQ